MAPVSTTPAAQGTPSSARPPLAHASSPGHAPAPAATPNPTTTTTTPTAATATHQPSPSKADSSADAVSTDGASSEASTNLPADIIDMDTFGQLLEMDDEDDRGFSQEIVWNFFEQANTTFQEMDDALGTKDLPKLSTLGHFLKGSSAAVGVIRVRDGCEAMQHLVGGKQCGHLTTTPFYDH